MHETPLDEDATLENRERTMTSGSNRETDAEHELEQSANPIIVTPSRIHGILSEVATLSMLGIFSFLGLLARLGLIAISSYSGQPTFSILWAQVTGCAIMGAVAERRADLEKLYLPLYVGLATGLCGSITSFSTWMADVFRGFAQIDSLYNPHSGFYNFMDGFTQSMITLAASVAASVFGSHLAPYFFPTSVLQRMTTHEAAPRDKRRIAPQIRQNGVSSGHAGQHARSLNGEKIRNEKHANSPARSSRSPRMLPLLCLILLTAMWLAAILVTVYVPRWRGIVMFSVVFAPLGTWLRFYLSKLNTAHPRFPLGTFLANIIGTALLAGILALQRTGNRSLLQCQILQGWDEGFCGCLTTVSTFVMEVRKLDRAACYRYVLISWIAGQLIMLVVLGTVDFQRGGLSPPCSLT